MPKPQFHLLVVEDSPADRLLIEDCLVHDPLADYDLACVDLLKAALEILKERSFDLALLDLGLPDSLGLETFISLHQSAPHLPVIVLSGRADEGLALQAVQAGAQDYLVKGRQEWNDIGRAVRYAIERRKGEERFSAVFHSSPTPQLILNGETGRILEANAACCRLVGRSPAELFSQKPADSDIRVNPGDWEEIVRLLQQDGRVQDLEIEIHTQSSRPLFLLASLEPIEFHGEKCLLVSAVDITRRKLAEMELKESEERFSTVFYNSPVAQSIFTRENSEIIAVNAACSRLFGYSPQELIGVSTAKLNLWSNPAERQAALEELQDTGRMLPRETTARVKSGELRSIIAALDPVVWKGVPCLVSSIVDITDRKRAELTLRKSQESFSRLFDANPAALSLTRREDGRFLRTNPAYSQMLGYQPHELAGHTVARVRLYADPGQWAELLRLLAEHGTVRGHETVLRDRSGALVEALVFMEPIAYNGEACILSTLVDISSRKQAEQQIEHNAADLALLNRLHAAVNRGARLDELAKILDLECAPLFHTHQSLLFLLDPEQGSLSLQYFPVAEPLQELMESTLGAPQPKIGIALADGGLLARAMHSGQAQVLSDPQAIRQWMLDFIHSCSLSSEHLPAILQQIPLYQVSMNIGCVACLPLHSGAAAAGVWVLTAGQAFSPADLERLQKLGLQLAEVIFHVQTQDALQASEEQFRRLSAEMEQRVLQRTAEVRDLYENAPAGYHSLDTAGCLVTINQTELDWLGYSRPEVIGRPILELFPAQQGGLPAKFSGISEKRPA